MTHDVEGPKCPDCGGPAAILPPEGANFEEIPPGWDALFVIIFNPLSGPLAFLTRPWFCRECKKEIPKDKIPGQFRSQRRKIGWSFVLIGIVIAALVIVILIESRKI